MQGMPLKTARQTRLTSPPTAKESPAKTTKRTTHYLPGAFLLFALIGVVAYGANSPSSTNASTQTDPPSTQLEVKTEASAAPAPLTVNQPNNEDNTMNEQPHKDSVSTSITNTNGQTTVTVNGEAVVTPSDGNVSKTITTDNGDTVNINVSQGSNTSSGTVNSFSSSTSNSWSFSSGSTHMSGNN